MKRSWALQAILLALLPAGWVWFRASGSKPALTVVFLDVGQGDCIVVRTPNEHVLIVDAGSITPEDDMGRRIVLPYLRAQGINRVDALLLTHPDDDHVGGAVSLLERIPIGRLLISGLPSISPVYAHVLETARRRGVPVITLARGQTIDFHDSVVAEVLNPPVGRLPRSEHADNDGSLVIRVRKGRTDVLLTGDAEQIAEHDMIRSGADMRADVLKLGHHGSRSSSSDEFLEAVHPSAVVVSAGRRNVYGHPNPDVLARAAAKGMRIFRTDEQGAITVTSDGERLSIHAERSVVTP